MGPIAEVMVHVSNTSDGFRWYSEAFPNASICTFTGSDDRYLDVDGVILELVKADIKVGCGAAGSVVYWHTNEFDKRLEYLQRLGAVLYRGPLVLEEGKKMCQVKDPWGNCIGLMGP